MKYKDFKVMSKNDMKKVIGGSDPLDICATVCPGGGYAWQCDTPPAGHSYYNCTQSSSSPGDFCHLLATCVIA
ncbi:bacteriocin [Ferruginibacter sp.]|nr:bacteriocin [Ferruginibacter sp.]